MNFRFFSSQHKFLIWFFIFFFNSLQKHYPYLEATFFSFVRQRKISVKTIYPKIVKGIVRYFQLPTYSKCWLMKHLFSFSYNFKCSIYRTISYYKFELIKWELFHYNQGKSYSDPYILNTCTIYYKVHFYYYVKIAAKWEVIKQWREKWNYLTSPFYSYIDNAE